MTHDSQLSPGARFLFICAAFVIVVAGMRAAESILVPFLLSVFIAVISTPLLFWLRGKGIPNVVAMLLVALGIVAMVTIVVLMIGTSLNDFSKALPAYQTRLQADFATVLQKLSGWGVAVPDQLSSDTFDPSVIMQFAATLFAGLSAVLTNAFFILLTATFILLEAGSFPAKLRTILTDPDSSMVHLDKLTANVKRYVAMKTTISLLTGAVIALWLWILGVDYPMLWGLLAFLFNYVPNIGSIIAAVPAILLAFVQAGVNLAIGTAIGYVVVNIIVGNVVEPRVMGRGLGLSTLVVFLSLVFWGWVLGPVGMLLSVPLTMVVKIALESSDKTHWIGVLLGPEPEALGQQEENREKT